MHNLCILAGLIDGGIVTPDCVAAVGIAVAEVDRLRKCSLGHDAMSKIFVVCRNGRRVWRVNGGV